MELLREYQQWYNELEITNGDKWQNSGKMFVSDNGAVMHPDSPTGWMSKFAKRHGLPHTYPHKFRHTMASLLYFYGVDGMATSKRLGHAHVSTTENNYAQKIHKADEMAAEILADTILCNANSQTESK